VARQKGADEAIDSGDDIRNDVKRLTGAGADVVIDPVGGPLSERALRGLRWGGRFVSVGFASGEIPRIPLNLVLLKGLVVRGFEFTGLGANLPDEAARDRREVLDLLVAGRVEPHRCAVLPLPDAAEALAWAADRRAIGKVVLDLRQAAV
jgi:NADPH2:quinone reductase